MSQKQITLFWVSQTTTYYGYRKEKNSFVGVSQTTKLLVLGLAEKHISDVGSRRETKNLIGISQRTNLLIFDLAKKTTADFASIYLRVVPKYSPCPDMPRWEDAWV